MNFKNKKVVITGGTSGIGGAIAERFAKLDAKVIIVARTLEMLMKKQDKLRNFDVHILQADVSRENEVIKLSEDIKKQFGTTDVLINAAGLSIISPAEELTLEQWNTCLDVNSTGTFLMCREIGKQMIKSGRKGKIVNITSLVSHTAIPGRAAYAASKGAVTQLTQSLALEWGRHNINVNAISPGYVSTLKFKELIKQGVHNPSLLEERLPIGRLAEVDDIVGPVVFLSSKESDYITGETIKVDGGWSVNGYLNINGGS